MTDDLEDKGWKALEFLQKTNEESATLQYHAKRAEYLQKKSADAIFLAEEGPIEVRKALGRAGTEELYSQFLVAQFKADHMKNKRDTAQLTIDYIRTIMANRRMG